MKIKKITAGYLQPLLLPRKKNSHKGDYGRVLIVAGSRGMTGAAVLSARAALKAGAGLVTVACPDSEQPVIAAGVPEATTLPLPSKDGGFALRAAAALTAFREGIKFDLLLIGPGLSVKGEVPAFVAAVLRKPGLPAVIDADALNALALRGNLDSNTGAKNISIEIPKPGSYDFDQKNAIEIKMLQKRPTIKQMLTSPAVEYLDAGTIEFPLTLRSTEPGDRFHPLGAPGRKKIGDFLTDSKLTKAKRQHIPVLLSGNTILALVGLRIDHRYRITDKTKAVLKITWRADFLRC